MTKTQSSLVEIELLTMKYKEDARSFLLRVRFDGKSLIAPSRNQIAEGEVEQRCPIIPYRSWIRRQKSNCP